MFMNAGLYRQSSDAVGAICALDGNIAGNDVGAIGHRPGGVQRDGAANGGVG
jgi:hypothetical protein